MKVFSANIKNNPDMADAHVRHDIRSIKNWLTGWSVGFWQEIGERADHNAITAIFSRLRYYHLFGLKENPITVNRLTWTVEDRYAVKVGDGRAGVTPNRWMMVALLKNRRRGTKVAVINTHFISGAWYGQHTVQAWRKEQWNKHFQMMQAEIVELNQKGYSVICGGDFNIHVADLEKFTATQKFLASHGYDYLIWCPSPTGSKVSNIAHKVYDGFLYTDHKPIAVILTIA